MYYTSIVALGMLVISPLLSLPFILWDIYKQHRAGLVLFILFLAIMASLTAPVSDLFRHTRDYFDMANYSFDAFCHTLKDDFMVQTFAYFLQSCHIKYPVARMIYTIIGYSISFWIFDDLVRDKYSNKDYFLLFVFFFITSGFFPFVIGVRHGFALRFFLLGFYLLYVKGFKIGALIPLMIAPCIHFSFISFCLLVYFLYFWRFEISNRVFVLAAFLLFGIGLILSTFIVKNFFESHTDYLEGQWGTDFQANASLKGLIFFYVGRISWIPLLVFFIKEKGRNIDEHWNNLIYVFALLFCMTYQLATISGRVMGPLVSLLVIFFIKYNAYCSQKLEKVILACTVFSFLCSVWAFRTVIINPGISAYNEAWKPLPIVLQHDFDKHWVYTHITSDGEIKNKYK